MPTNLKQLSNPFSTGSGGSVFESRIQSALVALMLSKGVCPCLPPWPIYQVKLQGKYSGFATDDAIVYARDERLGREAKLLAQIKHAPSITKSDASFAEVIQSAWNDFKNPAVFDERYDAIALITGPLTSTDTYDVRDMLEMAREAQGSVDFFEKVKLANFSSIGKQDKLEIFQFHLTNANNGTTPDAESTHRFLKSFHLLGYDLDVRAAGSVSLLQSLIGVASSEDVEKVWLKILNEVQSSSPRAGVMTLKSLPRELLDCFRVSVPPQLPAVSVVPIRETIAAALIGAWDENAQGDMNLIEQFTGLSFSTWQDKIRDVWLNAPGIFEQRDGKWAVSNRIAMWDREGPRVSDALLDKFKGLAVSILKEKDPALELATGDRFTADMRGKSRQYSGRIRKGVAETLALLGSRGGSLSTCSLGKTDSIAHSAVREVLRGGDWDLWASVDDILPLLAEASPEAFSEAVHDAVTSESGAFAKVFAQESPGIMGRTYITGVLWGLETLAWNSDYIVQVCRILGDMASMDPGGNWSNRPENSLTSILLPWLPQTCATTEKRHAAVKTVVKQHPDVGWKLLLSLLPDAHSTSTGTHKPTYRKYIPEDWKDAVPQSQYWEDILAYSYEALEIAGTEIDKLSKLSERYFYLPIEIRNKLRERLTSEPVLAFTEADRSQLWSVLTRLTTNHRKFADHDNWKVPEGALEELDVIADKLSPTAPEIKHKRLFGGIDVDLYDDIGDWDAQRLKLEKRRQDAIKEIEAAGGTDLLLQFASEVGEPWQVGLAFGMLADTPTDGFILPLLVSDLKGWAQFAGGYVVGRFRSKGWLWVDQIDFSKWAADLKSRFFVNLPFSADTWSRVAKVLGSDEGAYWKQAAAHPFDDPAGVESALNNLIDFGRADAAIHCMHLIMHRDKKGDSTVALRALNSLSPSNRIDAYEIGELITFLQKQPSVDENELRKIEWTFLPILGEFHNGQPISLSRWLAEDPAFFCDVIRTVFRSTKVSERIEPTDELRKKARNAYRLLREWRIPPGTCRDGTFDPGALKSWFQTVKTSCLESGHWEVSANQIGEVLFYAPRDQDKLWIEPVCVLLDANDHAALRRGLTIEIFNLRGVFTPNGGKSELALAEEWSKMATLAESKGFSLLGQDLTRLANSYRKDAERESRGEDI